MVAACFVLLYLQARASGLYERLREDERGEMTLKTWAAIIFAIALWKLFPQTFLGFFGYTRDMLFNGLHDAAQTHAVNGPIHPSHAEIHTQLSPAVHDGAQQAANSVRQAARAHLLHRPVQH